MKYLPEQKADQLAVYKRDRGVEHGSTVTQAPDRGRSWTFSQDLLTSWCPNHSATLPQIY